MIKDDFGGQEIEDGLYDEIEELPTISIQNQLFQYPRFVLLQLRRLTDALQCGFDIFSDPYIPQIRNLSREQLTEFPSSASQIFNRLQTSK